VEKISIVYWQDGAFWLGHLQNYPDYITQGESLEDLQEHLRDLYKDIQSGAIPGLKKIMELTVSCKERAS